MDKLFYIIFNSYYKKGKFRNDIPPLTVGGIFLIFFFSIGMTPFVLIFDVTLPPSLRKTAAAEMMAPYKYVALAALAITYFGFFFNNRFLKIDQRYSTSKFLNSIGAKVIGVLICLLGILLPIMTALVKNKIYTGKWV